MSSWADAVEAFDPLAAFPLSFPTAVTRGTSEASNGYTMVVGSEISPDGSDFVAAASSLPGVDTTSLSGWGGADNSIVFSPLAEELLAAPTAFTMLFLWKPTTTSGIQTIASRDTSTSGTQRQFQFRANGGRLEFIVWDGSGSLKQVLAPAANLVVANQWNLVGVTWDGATLSLLRGTEGNPVVVDGTLSLSSVRPIYQALTLGEYYKTPDVDPTFGATDGNALSGDLHWPIFDDAARALVDINALWSAAQTTGAEESELVSGEVALGGSSLTHEAPVDTDLVAGEVEVEGPSLTHEFSTSLVPGEVALGGDSLTHDAPIDTDLAAGEIHLAGSPLTHESGIAYDLIVGEVALGGNSLTHDAPTETNLVAGEIELGGSPLSTTFPGTHDLVAGGVELGGGVLEHWVFNNFSESTAAPAPSPSGVHVEAAAIATEPPSIGPGVIPGTVEVWEGVIEHHEVLVESHPMPALSAVKTRMVEGPGKDYEMIRYKLGRIHAFVGGVDVTFLRNQSTDIVSWQSVNPVGDVSAQINFPQLNPWDELGAGDLHMFTPDAEVELRLEKIAGGYIPLWEGNLAKRKDVLTPDEQLVSYECEGTFWQAAHSPWHPPFYLDLTDVGILIAEALNSVPNRRYAKVLPFITGVKTDKRGSHQQNVLQRVQELLAIARQPDGSQLTLKKIGPRNYQLAWKDRTVVKGTVTKGARDIALSIEKDEHARVDAVYCHGITPRGGIWANWHFPGLDLYVPPPYPYNNAAETMNIGDTDAGTSTGSGVSDWQRRVNTLGYRLAVTGTFTPNDRQAALWVQRLRGIDDDGIVGPQTWNATWDIGPDAANWNPIRLPMAEKLETQEFFYTANGAEAGRNPDWDRTITRHAIDLNLGDDVWKTEGREIARRYLEAFKESGWAGQLVLGTDLHDGTSRFELREGDNIDVLGHDGTTTMMISDVRHTLLFSYLLVDELGRDAYDLDAVLARNKDARQQLPQRPGNPRRLAELVRDHVVQFEDESKAGQFPRVAVNGNVGLWSVIPVYVGKTGNIAISKFVTDSPATTMSVHVFGKPITANQIAAMCPNPLVDGDPWRDLEETLVKKFAWIMGWGEPGGRWGFYPRQESDGGPVTGIGKDTAGFPFFSEVGGTVWVAVFTDVSCFIEGELIPGMPQ